MCVVVGNGLELLVLGLVVVWVVVGNGFELVVLGLAAVWAVVGNGFVLLPSRGCEWLGAWMGPGLGSLANTVWLWAWMAPGA